LQASLQIATGSTIESAIMSEPGKQMLEYLGQPTDGQGRFQGSLSEHLFLHNGDLVRSLCRPNKGNLPEKWLTGSEDWNTKVEKMFLTVLTRPVTTEEKDRFVKYLSTETKDAKDPKLAAAQRMEDAMWVLVSCSEFRFNR